MTAQRGSQAERSDVIPIDVQKVRLDTPACQQIVHLNNAGASLMPEPVVDACISQLRLEATRGGYEAYNSRVEDFESLYDDVAALIGALPQEIAILDSGTRAWASAVYAVPLQAGDRILTSNVEYASNYIALLDLAQRTGATIEVIPDDESGQVSTEALQDLVDERVKLISLVHVPTNGGLVNPAVEVGRIARRCGAIYVLDAVQSIGQMPLDVEEIGCDILAATGRKYLRGPRGTGFLYVRERLLDDLKPPVLDLLSATWEDPTTFRIRSDARRFELWEKNYSAHAGLQAAIRYAQGLGLAAIEMRVVELSSRLRAQLAEIPGVCVRDLGRTKCGIVTFTVDSVTAEQVRDALAERAITVSVSRARSTRLDMERRGLPSLVRASVHYYNTSEELDRLCDQVRELARNSVGRAASVD